MSHLEINAQYETEKRLKIAENISSQLEGIVEGAILGGSMGYGPNISVNKNSDIDQIIICDKNKIELLIKVPYFKGEIKKEVIEMFQQGEINFFWITKHVEGIEVNSFIYETEKYVNFCLMKGNLKGYISKRPSDIQKNYGFDGSLIKFKRNVTPYRKGFTYEKPSLAGGKFFGAPPRDDFTRGYCTLIQEGKFIDDLREKVWDLICDKLIEEQGQNIDLEKTNILQSEFVYKARPERFPEKRIKEIEEETKQRIERKLKDPL